MTSRAERRVPTPLLPKPVTAGSASVEEILRKRRSVREFQPSSLPLASVGQLLWAAQGVTSPGGERAAPSAGALYPLEILLVAGSVDGLAPGVYRYRSQDHGLRSYLGGDRRRELAAAALEQSAVEDAPAALAIAAVYARTARKYGTRAERYVHVEVGHAAQNVYLQAQALGLGTVIIGAFDDDAVARVLELDPAEAPLALLPVGVPST
jgi:SagB-type dehydrogenase family enzyme